MSTLTAHWESRIASFFEKNNYVTDMSNGQELIITDYG